MARKIAQDHGDKRTQILRIAARVFANHGFHGATMDQIASACGISKGNIYHYYQSKDALLFDVLETYLRGLRDQVAALALDGLSDKEALRQLIRATLRAYQGSDHEHKVQISAMRTLARPQVKLLQGYQHDLVLQFSRRIAAVAPRKIANDPANLRAATMSVFGMLNWYFMWNSGAGATARDAYGDMVANLTMGGLDAV